MKRSVVILSLLFIVLSLYAVDTDVLFYQGAGSEIPSNSLLVNFEIDSSQALRTEQNPEGTQTELFWFGFYSKQDDLSDGTLTFKESPAGTSSGNTITYTAAATFDYYVYILSNNIYKLKLEWTDLVNNSNSISYQINGKGSGIELCTSNPAQGIFYKQSGQLTAKTVQYEIPITTEAKVYTGTMTLTLESAS